MTKIGGAWAVVALVGLVVLMGKGGSGVELMIQIPAGREECFWEFAGRNKTLFVGYSVVGTSQGELDINFQLSDGRSRPLISEFRKTESRHELPIQEEGYFKACFDNTFSHFSHKTVSFEMTTENDEDAFRDYDEHQFQPEAQMYDVQVNDIKASVERVRVHLNKIQTTQDQFRIVELKDRTFAESNFERVNFWSMIFLVVLVFLGILQVCLVKSFFDDKYTVRGYIKKMKR